MLRLASRRRYGSSKPNKPHQASTLSVGAMPRLSDASCRAARAELLLLAQLLANEIDRGIEAAQAIDEPKLIGFEAAVDAPARELFDLFGWSPPAARDDRHEIAIEAVDFTGHRLALACVERSARRQHVGPRSALDELGDDPEPLEQRREHEVRGDDTDRPGDGRRLGHDGVGAGCNVVAAARRDVDEIGDDRLLLRETHDLVIDAIGGEYAAPRRVDDHDYTGDAARLARRAQRSDDGFVDGDAPESERRPRNDG